MASLSPNLAHLTDELPADKRADIEAAISSSPYLRQIMTEATNAGTLEHIRIGDPNANEGGHYDESEKAIYLSPNTFTRSVLKNDAEKRLDIITSTLGHETGHALHAEKSRKELYFSTASITDGIRAAGPGGEYDATGLVGAYIRNARRDEAMAEIHGWNALASRIEHLEGEPPSLKDMMKRAGPTTGCVDPSKDGLGYRLAPGIVLDQDMQMSDTRLPKAGPINLEPVAQCHFDHSGKSLGAGGGANYPNYYGAYLIQQLADDTRDWQNPPTIRLDMQKLGLEKAQLESTGLRLGDAGFYFVDMSDGRQRPVVLRGGSGMRGTPDGAEQSLAVDAPAAKPPLITEPGHSAHAMYLQAERLLAQIEVGPGMGGLSQHERHTLGASAVAMSLSAEGWRFTGFDHAVPGRIDPQIGRPESVFMVQGRLDDPAHQRVAIDVDRAVSQSIERSSDLAQTVMHTREQTQALEQVRAEQQDMDGPKTPAMRIGARTPSAPQGPAADSGGDGG